MSDHPAHKMPTANQMDRFTEAFTKIVTLGLSAGLLEKPEEFFVVSVRTGDAWNMGTGKPSDWHRDTIALAEAETLREIAQMLSTELTPPDDVGTADLWSFYDDVLSGLVHDLKTRADETDPT